MTRAALVTLALAFALALALPARAADRRNPLAMTTAAGKPVENCADPTVIRGQTAGDTDWYMYCTSDPLGDWDKDGSGNWRTRLIPVHRSGDLVHWTYAGNAIATRPAWAEAWAGLWAPEISHQGGRYVLYYSVTDTKAAVSGEAGCGDDSAIAVAVSASPTGPFTTSSEPAVRPRRGGAGCRFYATIDPEVIVEPGGQKRIYYGSFYGGLETRTLSADGLTSDAMSAVTVGAWDFLEGPVVVRRDGFYYLMGSAAGCCNGPLSGYGVFAGRSASPTGPFLDRFGQSLADAHAGGTTVLQANGNRWVGPGHHTYLEDFAGQGWAIYHAIDENAPYYAGSPGYTKRPALIDPVDWTDGWPVVRGGWSASDCVQAAPVAQPGGVPEYVATLRPAERIGAPLPALSDEFDAPALGPQWSWIRPPAAGAWALEAGALRLDTQDADLHEDRNDAAVLVEPVPAGDFVVETRVRVTYPWSGCCYNNVQGGLVIYRDDDNYVKLAAAVVWNARVTEFAKEIAPVPAGWPRYDGGRAGAPGDWTWLRIARRGVYGGELYTASTSRDGVNWTPGGTWRHALGAGARIGLVSMNLAGYSAFFDHLRVFALDAPACADPAEDDPCDHDGDGTGDACDPDDDADDVADLGDCAPFDATQARPPEIRALHVAEDTISWSAAPSAEHYDLARGALRDRPPADYGTCLADDLPASSFTDPANPPGGDAFFYLVRGTDAGCGGAGTYGATSDGIERTNGNPAACP